MKSRAALVDLRLTMAISVTLPSLGCAANSRVDMKPQRIAAFQRVAVLPFSDAPGADAGNSGSVVCGEITRECLSVPGWAVVERARIDAILDEQDLQAAGVIDPQTAVRVGRILGADGIVVGHVAQYRIGSIPFFFLFTLDKDVYKVDFSLRLVDVATGEVCLAAQASFSSGISFEDAVGKGAAQIFEKVRAARGARAELIHIDTGRPIQ